MKEEDRSEDRPSPAGEQADPHIRNSVFAVCLTVLFVSSFAISGYTAGSFNHLIQLPLVQKLQDPSLYSKDVFVSTLPHYATPFWRVVAFCGNFMPLDHILRVGFLIERALMFVACCALAQAFAPKSRFVQILAVAFISLGPSPILGAGTLVPSYLEQTGFAIPFLLLAIAAFFRARPAICVVCMAVGFNLNCMYGVYALSYILLSGVVDPRYRQEPARWLAAAVLFVFLSLPAILGAFAALSDGDAGKDLWIEASRARLAHHLWPATWGAKRFVRYFVLAAATVFLLRDQRDSEPRLYLHGVAWAGVSAAWLLSSFVVAYVVASPTFLVMHPARGTDLWYCLSTVTIIACADRMLATPKPRRVFGLACALGILALWIRPKITNLIISLGMLFAAWRPVGAALLQRDMRERLALLVSLAVMFIGIASVRTRSMEFSGNGIVFSLVGLPERQIAEWAASQTPKDALFLVHPGWAPQFRTISRRSVFVGYKDGSAILWNRSFVDTWVTRLAAIGLDLTRQQDHRDLDSVYADLNDKRVAALSKQYGLDYWIVTTATASRFETLFDGGGYKVLQLY